MGRRCPSSALSWNNIQLTKWTASVMRVQFASVALFHFKKRNMAAGAH